jgi:hypothetical protein
MPLADDAQEIGLLFPAVRISGNGPSRHFVLRINCVALGANRTSASVDHAT